MSEKLTKFGELAIRTSPSSLGEDEETNEVFSTIDLSTGGIDTPNSLASQNSSYTSFGQSLKQNHSIYPNFTESIESKQDNFNLSNSIDGQNKQTESSKYPSFNKTYLYNSSNSNGNNNQSSMFSIAGETSNNLVNKTASSLETLKQWSKSAYKCTRQIVTEKLGKSSRTVDPELDCIIDNLRETRKKYDNILCLSRNLSIHFSNIIQTQKMLSETFSDLAQKSSELMDEFQSNSESQRHLIKHGETLVAGINVFISNLNTLCNKTMEDTLLTVNNYEGARLEYDAYKFDMENLQAGPKTEQKTQQINELEKDLGYFKQKYEKLKEDVKIKAKFLDENRVNVMKKQLALFQNAMSTYFTGNYLAIESTMKNFNLKLSQPNGNESNGKMKSFLEN